MSSSINWNLHQTKWCFNAPDSNTLMMCILRRPTISKYNHTLYLLVQNENNSSCLRLTFLISGIRLRYWYQAKIFEVNIHQTLRDYLSFYLNTDIRINSSTGQAPVLGQKRWRQNIGVMRPNRISSLFYSCICNLRQPRTFINKHTHTHILTKDK